ncbi:hypothetical protein MRX96_057064 [Rhipicephalus microplus]
MVVCLYSKSFTLKAFTLLVCFAVSYQKEASIVFEEVDVDVNARFGVVVLTDDSRQKNEISPELRSAQVHGRFKRADEEDGGGIEEHHGTIGHDDAGGHTGHGEFSIQETPVAVTYESDAAETGVPEMAVTYEMDSDIAEGSGVGGGDSGVTSINHGSRRYLTPTSGSGGNVRLGRIVYRGGGLQPGYGTIGTYLGTGSHLAYGLQPALATSGLALRGSPAMGHIRI